MKNNDVEKIKKASRVIAIELENQFIDKFVDELVSDLDKTPGLSEVKAMRDLVDYCHKAIADCSYLELASQSIINIRKSVNDLMSSDMYIEYEASIARLEKKLCASICSGW